MQRGDGKTREELSLATNVGHQSCINFERNKNTNKKNLESFRYIARFKQDQKSGSDPVQNCLDPQH